jgi:hypothetical protein
MRLLVILFFLGSTQSALAAKKIVINPDSAELTQLILENAKTFSEFFPSCANRIQKVSARELGKGKIEYLFEAYKVEGDMILANSELRIVSEQHQSAENFWKTYSASKLCPKK